EQYALATPAGRVREFAGQGRLGSAWHAGDQRAAAAKYATAEHGIQTRKAGGDPLAGRPVLDPCKVGGAHLDARRPDAHGELGERIARAPILGDLNALCGDAVLLAALQ